MQMQYLQKGFKIPATLAHTHMPELADMPLNQTRPIAVQMVLLPPCADDVTAETPAQEVHNFSKHVCNVRKLFKCTTMVYALSGLPLMQSKPRKEGWWLRGASCIHS
jgi:hypothetical protein